MASYVDFSANQRLLEGAWNHDLDAMANALAQGANINARRRHAKQGGYTPLMLWLSNDSDEPPLLEGVTWLLNHDARVDLRDLSGKSVAQHLLERRSTFDVEQVLPLFLAHGLTFGGESLSTVFFPSIHTCVEKHRSPTVLAHLLTNGAQIDDINHEGETALMAFVRQRFYHEVDLDWVKTIVRQGATTQVVSPVDGASLLSVACMQLDEHERAIDRLAVWLLEEGCSPNHAQALRKPSSLGGRYCHHLPLGQPLSNGYTPLHWAAFQGSQNVCQALLHHGANPLAQTSDRTKPWRSIDSFKPRMDVPGMSEGPGLTPRDLAVFHGRSPSLLALLEAAELGQVAQTPSMGLLSPSRSRL